jgi:hypothetical protein
MIIDDVFPFSLIYPDGRILEWDGAITKNRINTDGTMDVSTVILSTVREGSIYDREGAD